MSRVRRKQLALLFCLVLTIVFCSLLIISKQEQLLGRPSSKDVVIIQGGEDNDPDVRKMRDQVRRMMQHAWKGYVTYAWGSNELKPISRRGHNDSVFGAAPLGVTIVDSIDTLWIMGLTDEYDQARAWIEHDFNPNGADFDLSLFEVTIRLLGGLLSAHALTGDKLFYEKALDLGYRMLPAFNDPSGLPHSQVNLAKKTSYRGQSNLAEWGTLSLEFNHLAEVSGLRVFRDPIQRIYQAIDNMDSLYGLFPVYAEPVKKRKKYRITRPAAQRSRRTNDHYTMGAMGDSFYEYLLKNWLQSGRTDEKSKQLYLNAMDGVVNKLVQQSSKSGLIYLGQINFGQVERKMDHLACFAGGMLALGGRTLDIPDHVQLGASLTATCHESYNRTATKLGPEAFRFDDQLEAMASRSDAHYILRPEVVESYFILWRVTHDPKYRKWGWEAVQALEEHCRIEGGGYSGLRNVNDLHSPHDDVQQSFFLAETLKYLYLLFSDDRLIALDRWVFNTEAHPLPIRSGANPLDAAVS